MDFSFQNFVPSIFSPKLTWLVYNYQESRAQNKANGEPHCSNRLEHLILFLLLLFVCACVSFFHVYHMHCVKILLLFVLEVASTFLLSFLFETLLFKSLLSLWFFFSSLFETLYNSSFLSFFLSFFFIWLYCKLKIIFYDFLVLWRRYTVAHLTCRCCSIFWWKLKEFGQQFSFLVSLMENSRTNLR